MKETNFDDPKERIQAVADFKSLINSAGWQRLTFIVNANIEVLKDQILDGLEDETKETIDRLRDKLKVHKEIINTPEYWIKRLGPSDVVEEFNDDPFTTMEEEAKKTT